MVSHHLHKTDNTGVALAGLQKPYLLAGVHPPADYLDSILLLSLSVHTPTTHREAAVTKDLFFHINPVLLEESSILDFHPNKVGDAGSLIW